MSDLRHARLRPDVSERLTRWLLEHYEQGAPIRALSRECGRSYGDVRRRLLEAGVTMRGRGGSTPARRVTYQFRDTPPV